MLMRKSDVETKKVMGSSIGFAFGKVMAVGDVVRYGSSLPLPEKPRIV